MWKTIAVLIAAFLAMGIVGQADYEDARVDECWGQGRQHYDATSDTCYTPKEKLNAQT
jgi:hypothetical protein